MPEGHLAHHHARRHAAGFVGQPVQAASPQGRVDADRLDGHVVTSVEAYGKWEVVDLAAAPTVAVHLGQRGVWLHAEPPAVAARPQVRLRLASSRLVTDLIAPMRCDLLDADARRELVAGLGEDPLRADADVDRLWSRLSGSDQAIGAVLLDQSRFAGVGNVLRAEALARCCLDPRMPARELSRDGFDELWATLVDLMSRAAVRGQILTAEPAAPALRPDEQADDPGASRLVYRRDTCGRCGAAVRSWHLGGRTMWACSRCQRHGATSPLPG